MISLRLVPLSRLLSFSRSGPWCARRAGVRGMYVGAIPTRRTRARSSVTAWHPMKRACFTYMLIPSVGDIHYNSEREPYNMMHLWYANRGQNITLRRRRDSSLPADDGDIPEFQHASLPRQHFARLIVEYNARIVNASENARSRAM